MQYDTGHMYVKWQIGQVEPAAGGLEHTNTRFEHTNTGAALAPAA